MTLFGAEQPDWEDKEEVGEQVGSMCVGGRRMLNLEIMLH